MKNELRIGNFVIFEQTTHSITAILKEHCDSIWSDTQKENYNHSYEDIKPIPLTEDWLLKFGFEKSGDHYVKWINDTNTFILLNDYTVCDMDIRIRVKHVHQLQNLYFALTGKELSI